MYLKGYNMKTTQVITFSPKDYVSGQNPVVNVIHTNDYGESVLSLWLNGEVSCNNVIIDDNTSLLEAFGSKAAMASAVVTWRQAINAIENEPMNKVRGNVYISPKAMDKLNRDLGIFPQESHYLSGSYDSFSYPAAHAPAFIYTSGSVCNRGTFYLASEFDDRGRVCKYINESAMHNTQTMTDAEIAAVKTDHYACKNAYELTVEKYPDADIRMVHDSIRVIDDSRASEINNYYWRAHDKFISLACENLQSDLEATASWYNR